MNYFYLFQKKKKDQKNINEAVDSMFVHVLIYKL